MLSQMTQMMPDPTNLFFSIFFGVLGSAYCIYGRKQNLFFVLPGIGLIIYTFFVSTTAQVIWIGVILAIVPFILTKFFGD